MKQILEIGTKLIEFDFIEEGNVWLSKTTINDINIEIEIDKHFHHDEIIDWDYFKAFYTFIDQKDRLKHLINDSQKLAEELGKAFFRECSDNISDYKMEFNGSILYNGRTNGNFIANGYSYSLVFNYFARRDDGICGDDYGIYLVDIDNLFIVGAKRYQS